MPYRIAFAPVAARQLRGLAADDQKRLRPHIDRLAHDPRPPDCRKLKGHPDLYRIRVGNFRIVYTIEDRELTVLVAAIGQRGDIYREIKRLSRR